MTKIEFGFLQDERHDLEQLIQLYELACADIAPPIKVLDGMPYSLTNAVNSMTENKAVKAADIHDMIGRKQETIRVMLGDMSRIPREDIRQAIIQRFLCCYDWQTIKDKTGVKMRRETLRMLCNYHIKKNL